MLIEGQPKQLYWKINPFWFELFPNPDPVVEAMAHFFTIQNTVSLGMLCDTLKAFLRGQFIHLISAIKTGIKEWETTVLREAAREESKYVTQPTEGTRRAWFAAQDMALQVSCTKAENERFF